MTPPLTLGGGDLSTREQSVKEIQKGIFVALPSYEGKIYCDTADAVIREVFAAHQKGIQFVPQFRINNMMSAMVRNWMVGKFLEGNLSHMAFVDWDVHFPTGTLVRLMERDVDICGAAYPFRSDPVDFPMAWLGAPGSPIYMVNPKTNERDDKGLVEVSGIPTGCLVIKRECLEKMIALRPDLEYFEPSLPDKKAYSLFEWVRKEKLIYTEDFAFCYLARECGYRVWLDPDIDMMHVGPKQFKGNIAKWMQGRHVAEMADTERAEALERQMKTIMAFNEDAKKKVEGLRNAA